jgi:hypothetical protein
MIVCVTEEEKQLKQQTVLPRLHFVGNLAVSHCVEMEYAIIPQRVPGQVFKRQPYPEMK